MTNLTDKQLELLMAHLDGETNEQEAEDANELLQDSGVQEYFDTFLKMRGLINKHSAVTAPAGLKDRILAEIKADINAEAVSDTGTEAPIHQLPTASWWAPLIGVAAAIVLVLAVTFGGDGRDQTTDVASKATPEPSNQADSEADTARDFADGRIATLRDDEKDKQPAADPEAEPTELLKKLGKAERLAEKEMPEGMLEDFKRKELQDGVNGDTDDVLEKNENSTPDTRENLKGSRRKDAEDSNNDTSLGGGGGFGGAAKPAESKRESSEEAPQRTSRGTSKANDAETGAPKADSNTPSKEEAAKSGWGGGAPSPGNKKSRARHTADRPSDTADRPSDTAEDEADGGDTDGETVDGRKVSPPTVEPDAPAKPRHQGAEQVIEVVSPEGRKLAAQTDLLWVSGIYGQAEINADDESEVEAITVEITADQLPKLIAALKELADKQSYGQITHLKKQQANKDGIVKLTIRIK